MLWCLEQELVELWQVGTQTNISHISLCKGFISLPIYHVQE